jgi:hypothetical protein
MTLAGEAKGDASVQTEPYLRHTALEINLVICVKIARY